MIFEYALEPELAASWHDFQNARYFKEKFGVGRGRLVSRYPKDWKARVWQAFDGSGLQRDSVEYQNGRKHLEALLTVLTKKMVVRGQPLCGDQWLGGAEKEHDRSPFHAILATANPRRNPAVVLGETIDEETQPRWKAPSSHPVPRDAHQLAQLMSPMLRCASTVIFVDPNFRPEEWRFRQTLGAFLAAMLEGRPGPPPHRVELQVDQDKYKYGGRDFKESCEKRLPELVPAAISLRIIRWKQRLGGQELHNRFVLTDIGGVSFGHGLDESYNRGSEDLVSRLDEGAYWHLWEQYASSPPAFDCEEPPLVIDGKAKIPNRRGVT